MQLNALGLVHDFLKRNIKEGAFCIDATAGRGRDTELLCRLAGRSGRVLAFDIQKEAVESTRERLAENGLCAGVILDSHVNMERYAKIETVDCIVFNFGRLPGGDRNIFTLAETSVLAIDAGLNLLKPGGVMALAMYYGGANGYTEKDAVISHLGRLDPKIYTVLKCDWLNRSNNPPFPLFIWKEKN